MEVLAKWALVTDEREPETNSQVPCGVLQADQGHHRVYGRIVGKRTGGTEPDDWSWKNNLLYMPVTYEKRSLWG